MSAQRLFQNVHVATAIVLCSGEHYYNNQNSAAKGVISESRTLKLI